MAGKRLTSSELSALLDRNPNLKLLNPQIGQTARASASPAPFCGPEVTIQPPAGKVRKIRTAPTPKTRPEIEMNQMLERRLKAGEFAAFGFETMTIECGDGFRYTPDFTIWDSTGTLVFIEVKGGFIRRTGLQAFQAAKSKYSLARFELWQLSKGDWRKLSE